MSNMASYFDAKGVSRRIREIRIRLFGRRGLSRFARALGLAPSTYIEYEKGRIPPEKILRKIARLAQHPLRRINDGTKSQDRTKQENVSVEWLLGQPNTCLPTVKSLVGDKSVIPPQELKQFQTLKELLKQKSGREVIKAVLQSLSADEPTRRKSNALLRQF